MSNYLIVYIGGRVGDRVHAGHEPRAARGTDVPVVAVRVAHAFAGETVEVRRPDLLRAVAAEFRPQILGDEPEDVGTLCGGGAEGCHKKGGDHESWAHVRLPFSTGGRIYCLAFFLLLPVAFFSALGWVG